MEEDNDHNSLDGVIMENGEAEGKETKFTEEIDQANTPPVAESPQPMECDKMNGDVLLLSSPIDNPTAVVSPEVQNISHIETSSKEIRQNNQVIISGTPINKEQTTTSKPKSKKSKKSKIRRILPTVSTAVKANEELCEVQESPEGEVAGSTSPSPLSCTEYAQYLGLQPTVKFKCFKCSETGFSSINKLKEHQNLCLKSSRCNTPDSSTGSHSNNPAQNLRITRKVYMCSSCGTYFENWNLYIHMREVHRRHVCLICLGMFLHAEKLALHLSSKHNTTLEAFATTDDFLTAYPSSTFLTCCTCERIFSEQDNFFEHNCGEKKSCETKGCAMCGLEFAHTSSCPHADNTSREKRDKSLTPEKIPTVSTEPGTSKGDTVVQDTLQEEEHLETTLSIPNNLVVKPITKPPAKKRIRQRRPKKSALLEDDISKEPSPKLKPTCLRIKLAPVSRRVSKKLVKNCTNIDDSSDIEELPSPDLDLNEELKLLADDTSNPPTLQNGERSPSMSSPIVESLDDDDNNSNKTLDTGQNNDSDIELENKELNGDTKVQEENENECAKAVNNSICSDSDQEQHNDLSADENMEVDQDIVDAVEAASSMSEHDDAVELEKQDTFDETRESLSNHNESDDSLDNSDARTSDLGDSIDKTDSNILNQNDSIEKVDCVNELEKVGGDSLDENVDDSVNEEEDDEDKDEWQIDENSCKEEDEATEGDVSQNGEALLSPGHTKEEEEELQLAGEDSPLMDLVLESSPDQLPIQTILKQAIQEACDYSYCVYCTHARKIAVNGKQLAIHLLSEHRYQLVVNSERLACEKFIEHVKEHMKELETSYFNCDTYDSSDKENVSVFVKSYECFQCRFVTKVHKDLYLHNRKMHQKNGLVCIMCKSNFYSYSELLCHLCPGIYNVTNQPLFRCCFCSVDNLPSSFRFMVHVRKRHQACDVCLEFTSDQQKLSNHVWKHKLHHYCYRCGIAYRNKPDITKHLFWKHGTESVLCKRCLQKKWPYVYHFCIPPSTFTCEECNASFSRAVALKVHKRLHTNDLLYPCELCNDSFISRKLLARHDRTIHNPPPPEENPEPCETVDVEKITPPEKEEKEIFETPAIPIEEEKEAEKTPETTSVSDPPVVEKKVVDVYDLPPLNLSSESEDESDTEETKKTSQKPPMSESQNLEDTTKDKSGSDTELQIQDNVPQAVDSVWENFKDYKSSKDVKSTPPLDIPSTSSSEPLYPQPTTTEMLECVMFDHDYFGMSEATSSKVDTGPVEEVDISGEANASFEHNYCNNDEDNKTINEEEKAADNAVTPSKKKQKSPKKKHKSGGSCSSCSGSDSSSSDSSSSSCSCGTNCSCSSSSSSSSGSSSSDSSDSDSSTSDKDKKEKKKARRRERAKNRKEKVSKSESVTVNGHADVSGGEEPNVEDIAVDTGPPVLFFHESDLDTNESETDEDFYDEHPRLLMPNRNLLLLSSAIDSLLSPQATPAPTPPPSEVSDTFPVNNALLAQLAQEENVTNLPVKSSKSKKRKRSLSTPRRENKLKITIPNILHNQLKTNAIPKLSVQKKTKSKVPPLTPVQLPSSVMSPTFSSYPVTPATPQYGDVYSPAGSSDLRGSSSETDNLRLSKRRRVPKKFYGDSSDEEGQAPGTPSFSHIPQMPSFPPPPLPPPPPPPPPLVIKPPKKKIKQQTETVETTTIHRTPTEADLKLQAVLDFVAAGYDGRTADDEDIYKRLAEREKLKQPKLIITLDRSLSSHVTPEEIASSSSEEEEEEEEEESEEEETAAIVQTPERPAFSFLQRPIISNRHDSVKLYCYCQCPYDEVSEMIACDGKNCAIEWFHFECVGITVPPKGKWYCPDCRKRYNIAEPLPNPQYFYNASSEYMMSSTDPTPSYTET